MIERTYTVPTFFKFVSLILPTSREEIISTFEVAKSNSTWDTLVNALIKFANVDLAEQCSNATFLAFARCGKVQLHNFQLHGRFPSEFLLSTQEKYSLSRNTLIKSDDDFYRTDVGLKWFMSVLAFMQIVYQENDYLALKVNPKTIQDFRQLDQEKIKEFFTGANAMTGALALWEPHLNSNNPTLTVALNMISVRLN